MRVLSVLIATLWLASSTFTEHISALLLAGGEAKVERAAEPTEKKEARKSPTVVYLHSVAVGQSGYEGGAERRSDIADFTRAFANAGFVVVAPIPTTSVSEENRDEEA